MELYFDGIWVFVIVYFAWIWVMIVFGKVFRILRNINEMIL